MALFEFFLTSVSSLSPSHDRHLQLNKMYLHVLCQYSLQKKEHLILIPSFFSFDSFFSKLNNNFFINIGPTPTPYARMKKWVVAVVY